MHGRAFLSALPPPLRAAFLGRAADLFAAFDPVRHAGLPAGALRTPLAARVVLGARRVECVRGRLWLLLLGPSDRVLQCYYLNASLSTPAATTAGACAESALVPGAGHAEILEALLAAGHARVDARDGAGERERPPPRCGSWCRSGFKP